MSVYRDRVYPVLVDHLGNPPPIQALRRQLLSEARGMVLEIGVGSGANFPYYDISKISKLYALEPNPGMRRLAGQRCPTGLDVEFLSLPDELVALGDASVDTVVSTFTLCTISSVHEALNRLARVLRPGGALLFLENTVADDARVRWWQELWEPVHHRVFEGLFLTRDIPSLVTGAGLRIGQLNSVYLSHFPKSWSHCSVGIAIRD